MTKDSIWAWSPDTRRAFIIFSISTVIQLSAVSERVRNPFLKQARNWELELR
jgi:hypothetical protein|tara:strand:- start:374 stop:529 length:156 start_codon:yes stop_codon:yes gene_type:complete